MKQPTPDYKPAVRHRQLVLGVGIGVGVWCLVLGVFRTTHAQLSGSLSSDDFTTSEYYTNKITQVKMRLSGKHPHPSGPGRYRVQHLRLETFHEDGEPEITIEAPECLYDFKARTASSPGRLKILAGGDRFVVTGEGFLWQQAQASLIISNRVSTLVRELPKPKAKP